MTPPPGERREASGTADDPTIGIVGAGGAGGYFAARWCEAGLDVTVIARGAHLEAMRRDGLRLSSPSGDASVRPRLASDPAALATADFVLFATKTWQLGEAAAAAAPHLRADCLVCGVQNGVGSAAELARRIGGAHALGATCRIISFIDAPGIIRHVGVDPTILIGELHGGASTRVAELGATLSCGDRLAIVGSDDIVAEIWEKMLFFAPVSGVGSLTGVPIGEFRADPEGRDLLIAAIAEVAAVARAEGVALPQDASERALAFIDTIPGDGTSSMQRDFAAGRPTELDALSGEVSRRGRKLGVPTPTHDLIFDTLLPRDQAARAATGTGARGPGDTG